MQGRCKMASALLSQKLYLRLDRGEFMITIKDNIIKLDFHEETLHCDIYTDGTKWTWQQDYKPYFKYNEQFHIKDMIQE